MAQGCLLATLRVPAEVCHAAPPPSQPCNPPSWPLPCHTTVRIVQPRPGLPVGGCSDQPIVVQEGAAEAPDTGEGHGMAPLPYGSGHSHVQNVCADELRVVGRVGMMPGCMAVCSWRRLSASRHFPLPFPGTLCLREQRHPSASHPLVPSLSLPVAPSSPPYSPFLCLRRLCQRSPGTVPVALLRVGSTRRRATGRCHQGRKSMPVGSPGCTHVCAF